jgi:valyl-tRNA synthetase
MSKSTGNAIMPSEVIEKFSRDHLRFYLSELLTGEDTAFDWEAFKDINRLFNTLLNSFNYVQMYLSADFESAEKLSEKELLPEDWVGEKVRKAIGK